MHDARMLAVSDLYDDLENFAFCPAGREMCLSGDPAYPLRIYLQAPFRVGVLTRQMEISNEKMSAVRASVEWLFAEIVNYFKFLDFKKNLRIGSSQVGQMYCAILRNDSTCLYLTQLRSAIIARLFSLIVSLQLENKTKATYCTKELLRDTILNRA